MDIAEQERGREQQLRQQLRLQEQQQRWREQQLHQQQRLQEQQQRWAVLHLTGCNPVPAVDQLQQLRSQA